MHEWNVKLGWFLITTLFVVLTPSKTSAQQRPAISIIGTGTLAGSLGPALGQAGYEVVYGSRNPDRESVHELVARTGSTATAVSPSEAAARTGIIVLAVPAEVVQEVASGLGDLDGKLVVDVSVGDKRVAPDGYLELIPDSTNSERLQSRYPGARIVRVNLPSIVFFGDPLFTGTPPTVLIAGNDPGARGAWAQVIFDLGLNPWDAGPVRFSRIFDAINVLGLVPAQQGRHDAYELRLMPTAPLTCLFDVTEMFGFGRPNELDDLVEFPRRDPVTTCDEWMRRLGLDGRE